VASEVRSLAQRSAEAAKEIKTLIGASVDRVEVGSRLVAAAGASMSDIVASVQRVSDIIGEITAASSEQSDGIGQVNGAVVHLDQMTQQNAALVEESAAAAESLKDQARRLTEVVSVFRLGEDERGHHAHSAAPAHKPMSSTSAPAPQAKSHSFKATGSKAHTPSASKPVARPPVASPAPAVEAPTPAPAPRASKASAAAEGDWESF